MHLFCSNYPCFFGISALFLCMSFGIYFQPDYREDQITIMDLDFQSVTCPDLIL